MLRLFLNRLTVDDKHYLFNRDNLAQPIHMGLSEKQKTFSPFFFCIFKIYIKSYTFAKKRMTLIADVFRKIPAPENMVRLMSKKPCFRGALDRQQGKWDETLLQSEWQQLYNIY